MPVLTETIIDVADRHTTLAAFESRRAPAPPFRLASAADYTDLYRTLANEGPVDVPSANAGVSVVPRLRPAYRDHKFWHRVLSSRWYLSYPEMAWDGVIPIAGDVALRVDVAPADATYRVSPVPRVLVYPFGWSTWLSLRVCGPHTLDDLAGLVNDLFVARAIGVTGQTTRLSLFDLFDQVAAGVSRDVFGLTKAVDVDTQDALIVTTVLAKHGGSPALGGMSKIEEESLLRLVHPAGPPPRSLKKHVYRFDPDDPLQYVVFDDHGRFIWLEPLLIPEERNRRRLRCYHNNTFRSLTHAWHLVGLLRMARGAKRRTKDLRQLVAAAVDQLATPRYDNASLREYLETKGVKDVLLQAGTAGP